MNSAIINFHGLGDPHSWVDQDEARYWLTKGQYLAALDLIAEADMPALITFDDGNASDLEIGLPCLKERGLNAEFFVCSARVGKQGYLDSEGLRALASEAKGVGSHGRNHISWRAVEAGELKQEIAGSQRELEDVLGQAVVSAALPFGQYDSSALAQLRVAGFQRVYSSDGGPRLSSSWLQPRYSMRGDLDIQVQVERCMASASFASRLAQEARMTLKALR